MREYLRPRLRTAAVRRPTMSFLGPTSTEFHSGDCSLPQLQNPSWCFDVNTWFNSVNQILVDRRGKIWKQNDYHIFCAGTNKEISPCIRIPVLSSEALRKILVPSTWVRYRAKKATGKRYLNSAPYFPLWWSRVCLPYRPGLFNRLQYHSAQPLLSVPLGISCFGDFWHGCVRSWIHAYREC